jgi:hypothetical protein
LKNPEFFMFLLKTIFLGWHSQNDLRTSYDH